MSEVFVISEADEGASPVQGFPDHLWGHRRSIRGHLEGRKSVIHNPRCQTTAGEFGDGCAEGLSRLGAHGPGHRQDGVVDLEGGAHYRITTPRTE